MWIEDAVKNNEPWGTDRECESLQSKPSNLEKTGLGVGGMVQPQATGNRTISSTLSAQLFLRELLPSRAHVRFTKQFEDAKLRGKKSRCEFWFTSDRFEHIVYVSQN